MTQLKLTDDEKDSFNLKWGETFPSINPELIDCLGNTIEESIQTTQSRIIIIRQELEKQEFVLDYLKKLQLKKLERPHSVAPHPLTRAISHTTSFKPLKKLLSTHSRDSFCSVSFTLLNNLHSNYNIILNICNIIMIMIMLNLIYLVKIYMCKMYIIL